ncbi:hypothetical protein ABZU32_30085 [Sphaerisporangium sp. NPDC005288]|uniref:beta-xylosidase family glycoside hydrolase n=1 Tax=Sphaerisporangium sp. NPDC005288 TaxID=3155114 RepID=UPI0033BE4671
MTWCTGRRSATRWSGPASCACPPARLPRAGSTRPRSRSADSCTTKERPGWLTLRARGASLDDADVAFLGRRVQHLRWRARTLIDPTRGSGGLTVRLDERHHYEIEAADGRVRVIARIGSLRTVAAERAVPAGPLALGVHADDLPPKDARSGPDFAYEGRA